MSGSPWNKKFCDPKQAEKPEGKVGRPGSLRTDEIAEEVGTAAAKVKVGRTEPMQSNTTT